MISLEKWKILSPLQKLPNNVGNLGKLIVATGFKKLPKVQLIAQSGHTGHHAASCLCIQVNRMHICLRFSVCLHLL